MTLSQWYTTTITDTLTFNYHDIYVLQHLKYPKEIEREGGGGWGRWGGWDGRGKVGVGLPYIIQPGG